MDGYNEQSIMLNVLVIVTSNKAMQSAMGTAFIVIYVAMRFKTLAVDMIV